MIGKIFVKENYKSGFFGTGRDMERLVKRMKKHNVEVDIMPINLNRIPLLYMSHLDGKWIIFSSEYSLENVGSMATLDALRWGHTGDSAWNWAYNRTNSISKADTFRILKKNAGALVASGYKR